LQPPGLLVAGRISAHGQLEDARLGARLPRGTYEGRFHVAAWYRAAGVGLPAVPFLDVAVFRFGIDDPEQHYHLPMKLTPWGLSCFRGGA
jgi:5-hydroxyisourate hydrolase